MVQDPSRLKTFHLLYWLMNELADRNTVDEGGYFQLDHDCEFHSNPEKGACDFCNQWAELFEHMMEVGAPQPVLANLPSGDRREPSTPHPTTGTGIRDAFNAGFNAGYSNADDSYPGPDGPEAWEKYCAALSQGSPAPADAQGVEAVIAEIEKLRDEAATWRDREAAKFMAPGTLQYASEHLAYSRSLEIVRRLRDSLGHGGGE